MVIMKNICNASQYVKQLPPWIMLCIFIYHTIMVNFSKRYVCYSPLSQRAKKQGGRNSYTVHLRLCTWLTQSFSIMRINPFAYKRIIWNTSIEYGHTDVAINIGLL